MAMEVLLGDPKDMSLLMRASLEEGEPLWSFALQKPGYKNSWTVEVQVNESTYQGLSESVISRLGFELASDGAEDLFSDAIREMRHLAEVVFTTSNQ